MDQVHEAQEKRGVPDLRDLYMSDYTWTVESDKRETQTILRDELGTGPLDEEYLDTIEKSLTGELEQVDEIHEGLTSDPISNILYGRAVFTAQANDGLADTIKIMQDNDIGAVIVADTSQRPIGIFTESDVLRKVATRIDDLSQHRVVDFMTRNPDVLQSHVPIAHALYLMSIHRYRHVPIVNEDGIIVDVISFRDVVKYIQDHFV
jgi:CBS domain-containing protein